MSLGFHISQLLARYLMQFLFFTQAHAMDYKPGSLTWKASMHEGKKGSFQRALSSSVQAKGFGIIVPLLMSCRRQTLCQTLLYEWHVQPL